MASRRKYVKLEETIDFDWNSDNGDCDTLVGGLFSNKVDDFGCQLENNDNLEDWR